MVRKRRHIRQVQINRRYGALSAGERVRIMLLMRHALALFVSAESQEDGDEANLLRHAGAMVVMRVQRMRRGMAVLPPTICDHLRKGARHRRHHCQRGMDQLQEPQGGTAAFVSCVQLFRRACSYTQRRSLPRRERFPSSHQAPEVPWTLAGLTSGVRPRVHPVDSNLPRDDRLGIRQPPAQGVELPRVLLSPLPPDVQEGGMACTGGNFIGFIDGTLRRNCRRGGDPAVQEQVYDGHHCAHGLAWQSVVFPHGMMEIWGPEVGRRHDALLLARSGFNGRLANLQAGNPVCSTRCSSILRIPSSVTSTGVSAARILHMRRGPTTDSSRRSGSQWSGNSEKSFRCSRLSTSAINLKLRLQPIAKYYAIAVLLTNAHTCLFGSSTGFYFDMQAPSLEAYFAF
ncbi:unnamed protein product [Pylaiella littoralis]